MELSRLGHEVHVFTTNRRGQDLLGPEQERLDDITVHRLPVAFRMGYRLTIWSLLLKHLAKGSFDLVHTYDQGQFSTLYSSFLKRMGMIDSTLIVTTYGPLEIHADYPPWKLVPLRVYDRAVTPVILSNASMVLARNPTIIPWLISLGISEERIRVTPSGISPQCLTTRDPSRIRESWDLRGAQIIGYVGRLNVQKGVHHLMKAFPLVLQKIPQAALVLVGPDEGQRDELTRMAELLGVQGRIRVFGPVTELTRELEIMAAFDVFAMPSSFEGFSQAVLKAMGQSRPIVATRVGGLKWQVRDGVDGILVEYGDHISLSKALTEVLTDEPRARAMGENGKERARRFTYPSLAKELEQMYFEAAATP